VGLKYNLECSLICVLSSKCKATQNNVTIHFSLKIVSVTHTSVNSVNVILFLFASKYAFYTFIC
jgi:hypothetical protein